MMSYLDFIYLFIFFHFAFSSILIHTYCIAKRLLCVFVSHLFKIKFTVKIHTSSASSSSCVSIFNPCPAEPGYTLSLQTV